jgi:hypothetical protein
MESNDKLLHCDIVVLVEESVGLDPRRIQTRRFFGGALLLLLLLRTMIVMTEDQ